MLDKFLEVSYRSATEKTASRQLVDKLKQFPLEELQKLASGDETCKLAYGMDACGPGGSDNTWLGKYTGTPLFAKAVELEKALLQLDMEDQQLREQERAMKPQPSDTWAKRDAIQLQKRMLDLDLVMAQNGGAGEPAASPEAKEEKAIAELEGAQQEEAAVGGGEDAAHEATEDEAIKLLEQAHAGGGEGAPPQPPKAKPKALPKEEEVKQSAAKVAAIIEAGRFLAKTAAPLTLNAREHIADKNFAEPKADGPGDTGKYPIPDAKHARSALGLVGMHGSDSEKSKVRAAVAKKFPGLEKTDKTAGILGTALNAGKAALPAVGNALSAGKSLATSAYKSGGLGQVASSFGNVAKNFAQKNPLAAAGVAGAGGLVAGKMLSNTQPRQ